MRGAKRIDAAAIAGSISIVSTDSTVSEASSVCVVRPVPMPITATRFASGRYASGSAAVSVIVTSSEMRGPAGSMLIAPSDLPLVRRLRSVPKSTSLTVLVLPSRCEIMLASRSE